MQSKFSFWGRLLFLGCLFPVACNFIAYQGFSTNYTEHVFNLEDFKEHYEQGIYKYRWLGQKILLETFDFVSNYGVPIVPLPRALALLDPKADPLFYSAYFYVNTIFLCLTCGTLFFVLGGPRINEFVLVDLPVSFLCLLMALTQYVVVPYDLLSYFFLTLAAGLILTKRRSVLNSFGLCVVLMLAALTRETAVLILGFYVSVHFRDVFRKPESLKINPVQLEWIVLLVCFLGVYIGLRSVFGVERAVYDHFKLFYALNVKTLLGCAFFASIAGCVLMTGAHSKEVLIFCLVSLPYTLSILLVAEPWETRLWIPLLLMIVLLKIKAAQARLMQDSSL